MIIIINIIIIINKQTNKVMIQKLLLKSFCKFSLHLLQMMRLAYSRICKGKTPRELSDICQNNRTEGISD